VLVPVAVNMVIRRENHAAPVERALCQKLEVLVFHSFAASLALGLIYNVYMYKFIREEGRYQYDGCMIC
jgi:hypothetical protein